MEQRSQRIIKNDEVRCLVCFLFPFNMKNSYYTAKVCNTFDIKKHIPYLYKRDKETLKPHLTKSKNGIRFFKLKYKSPIVSPFEENNTVYAHFVEPEDRRYAVIFLHGLGVSDSSKWLYFATLLAKRGIAVLLIEMPYHMHRTPFGKRSGELFILPDAIKTFSSFEQTVLDVRKGIDFLKERGFLKIGIIGASIGAMISVLAQAVEKRIEKSVLILSGGDIGMLKWRSPAMRRVRKEHLSIGVTHGICIKNRKPFKKFLANIKSGELPQKVQASVACFYFDPLAFAHLIDRKNVLMINGLFDVIIPKNSTIKLWKALGKPKILWYPLSHFTIYLAYPAIIKRIYRFLLA